MFNIYSKKTINFLVILTGLYLIYYMIWRITKTINYSALLFSLILLAAELYGVVNYFLFAFMTKNIEKEERISPPEGLSVDIFIPTYNEDLEVLEATLIGCLKINYKIQFMF